MSDKTRIEWADATWNPTRGCSLDSEGCRHCYAMRQAGRFPWGRHLTKRAGGRTVWTGEVELLPERLDVPLRWKRPRRIFVDSGSDLFHPKVPPEFVAAVFAVAARAPQHVFLVLTKRARRMREVVPRITLGAALGELSVACPDAFRRPLGGDEAARIVENWPPPNLWLGVSVEDQPNADRRVPEALAMAWPRVFVSYEPALGPVDFTRLDGERANPRGDFFQVDALRGRHTDMARPCAPIGRIGWLIVGGESGPGARPFDVAWARSAVREARKAGVPVFVKQLGARPRDEHTTCADTHPPAECWPTGTRVDGHEVRLRDPKGGDMAEWPADLRVRELP